MSARQIPWELSPYRSGWAASLGKAGLTVTRLGLDSWRPAAGKHQSLPSSPAPLITFRKCGDERCRPSVLGGPQRSSSDQFARSQVVLNDEDEPFPAPVELSGPGAMSGRPVTGPICSTAIVLNAVLCKAWR